MRLIAQTYDQAYQRSSAQAKERLTRAKRRIDHIRAPVNNVAAGPISEIGLGFVLRSPRFLVVSRVPLNYINRLVNIKLHTLDFGEKLEATSRRGF